ncbi:hypothetical protein [Streptomyces europaeiscabiei]|uniref:hypothetical protein n=1 Tax=Streptomyces europaeiscabiei TaxID=146819 RepID=UPI002E2986C2|nr:hypothetical protein [Streptomyces europaeiscabiei]
MRTKNRVFTLLATSALLAGSSLTLGATNAAAADWTFAKHEGTGAGDFSATVRNPSGARAGALVWNANPGCCGIPGDAFQVLDLLSDTWGIEATMIVPVTGRKATTRGREAPYTSPWNTGDLREGTKVAIQLCAVRGDSKHCSIAYTGNA